MTTKTKSADFQQHQLKVSESQLWGIREGEGRGRGRGLKSKTRIKGGPGPKTVVGTPRLRAVVIWEKYTQLTLLPDFWHILLNSPISAGLCRRPQRRRALWGPWHWTRRCQRWSSWRRPPPPPPSSPPPSLTHSLWASLKHPQLSPLSCNQ